MGEVSYPGHIERVSDNRPMPESSDFHLGAFIVAGVY